MWTPIAVIQRARQSGFALDEVRTLFFGFRDGIRADARWRQLADRKLAELDEIAEQIASMQRLLNRLKTRCHCETLEMCGKGILQSGISTVERPPLPVNPQRRQQRAAVAKR